MTGQHVIWQGWPHAPAPAPALGWTARSSAILVDEARRPIQLGFWGRLRELLRHGWLRLLTAALRGFAACVVPRRAPAIATSRPGPGPVVLVIPVVPHQSLTFVYREVLAVLRQRPDWRILALARDDGAPLHDEAIAVKAQASFLRRDGITAAAWRALRWLLRRRGRELFALYRNAPGGSAGDLLGKLPLRDPRHPGNALLLADQLAPLAPRHLHVWSSTYAANVAMGAAHLLGVPFSISSYVDFEFPYAHKLLAAKLARATFCRVVTAFCRERLLAMPEAAGIAASRVPAILLGLDLANWRQRATAPGTGTLLTAARLVPKKGLHAMPAALAALRARGIACRWRVVGDGPEAAALRSGCERAGVADLVDWLGAQNNTVVREELLRADLAVLPCVIAADGERDGIPIFLCEAMALGVPVVTTPVSGIPELVRDGDTGYLARPGDPASLADALARALDDPAAARAIGERGRAEVHARLDVDLLVAQLIAAIER
jgi:glycosyltransferase involved in cell wall biosynthesis